LNDCIRFIHEENNSIGRGDPFWNLFVAKNGLGEDEMAADGVGDGER